MEVRNSLAALNVICDDRILNDNGIPLLFDWNIDDNLSEAILNDDSFIDLLNQRCLNIDNYSKSYVKYFSFKYRSDLSEDYFEGSIFVQDAIPLKEEDDIIVEYLLRIFKLMYKSFLKEEYEDEIMLSDESIIIDIYDKIQKRYPKRFVKESVINYVRMQLMKKYMLTQKNSNICILKLEKILKDK